MHDVWNGPKTATANPPDKSWKNIVIGLNMVALNWPIGRVSMISLDQYAKYATTMDRLEGT